MTFGYYEGASLAFVKSDGTSLSVGLGDAWRPLGWEPTGAAVIYTADVYGEGSMGLHTCKPTGKPEALIDDSVTAFDLLPGGPLLVAISEETGEFASRTRAQGFADYQDVTEPAWETELGGWCGESLWRPDGEAYACRQTTNEGEPKLYVGAPGEPPTELGGAVGRLIGWALGPVSAATNTGKASR